MTQNRHDYELDSTGEFCLRCGGRSFAPEHISAAPLPWKAHGATVLDADGKFVLAVASGLTQEERAQRAALIVSAVNAHVDLQTLLTRAHDREQVIAQRAADLQAEVAELRERIASSLGSWSAGRTGKTN